MTSTYHIDSRFRLIYGHLGHNPDDWCSYAMMCGEAAVQGYPPQTVLIQTAIFPSYWSFANVKNILYTQGYEVL